MFDSPRLPYSSTKPQDLLGLTHYKNGLKWIRRIEGPFGTDHSCKNISVLDSLKNQKCFRWWIRFTS
jgi:hypothetical protein